MGNRSHVYFSSTVLLTVNKWTEGRLERSVQVFEILEKKREREKVQYLEEVKKKGRKRENKGRKRENKGRTVRGKKEKKG